jgi:hypothetical protein
MKKADNRHASRRSFLKTSAALLGTYPLATGLVAAAPQQQISAAMPVPDGVRLVWLTRPLGAFGGATCGVAWPRGKVKKKTSFEARDENGNPVAIQSWPLAFWPDGSLKWTGHALVATAASGNAIYVSPAKQAPAATGISVSERGQQIEVDTGAMRCVVEKGGAILIRSFSQSGNAVAKDGRLVLIVQDQPAGGDRSL